MESSEWQPLTAAIFALLVVLHEGPRHGYGLMAEVARLTGGAIRLGPATLYRSLQRMRVAGLIEEIPLEEAGDDQHGRGDRRAERRRRYRITDVGRAATTAEAHRLAGLVEAARRAGVLDDSVSEEHMA